MVCDKGWRMKKKYFFKRQHSIEKSIIIMVFIVLKKK